MESTVWQTAVKGLVAMEAAPDTMIAMASSSITEYRQFLYRLLATSAPRAVTDLKLGMSA